METAIILNTWWLKVLGEIEAKKTENSMTTIENMKPKRKRKVEFPSIVADAKELDVSRIHLWNVLKGRRVSKSLSARYAALKAKQATEKGGSN